MIIITGANGQLGRAITERLLERLPAAQVGVSVRDPGQAEALRQRGVRVRQGSFEDPESLRHAFEDAAQVLIVSSNTAGTSALDQHGNALRAARAAGARRVVYTSHMGSSPTSAFSPMRDHAATEALLKDSGMAFTSLRHGFYAASGIMFMGRALETGTVAAPADGPVSWTAHADLAEAAAIALSEEGRLDGITPPLTSGEAHDLASLGAIAAELLGRPITRVVVPDEAHRAALVGFGVAPERADLLMGAFVASRQGEFAAVDPTLERLLGRPPLSMRAVLAEHVAKAR